MRNPAVYIFIILPLIIQSQPVIDIDNIPEPGLQYHFKRAILPGISIDSSGAGLTWDYSNFEYESDTFTRGYWMPLGLYPSVPQLDPVEKEMYDFSSTDSLQLFNVDTSVFTIAYEYDSYYDRNSSYHYKGYFEKARTVFPIPFYYQEQVADSFEFFVLAWETRNLNADAWGTLILPDTVYDNVIRLHYFDKHNYDDNTPTPHGSGSHDETNSYEFYTEDSEVPVLIVEYHFRHWWVDWMEGYIWDTTILVYDGAEILAPLIKCPSDTTVYIYSDTCCVWIDLEPPMVSHPPDLVETWNSLADSSTASGYFPVGSTVVTWYTMAGAQIDSCSLRVNVVNTYDIQEYEEMYHCKVYPNPSSDYIDFKFTVFHDQRVTIKIYDLDGMEISTVVDDLIMVGDHIVKFDAGQLPSGVYIYNFVTSKRVFTGKLVVVK